MPAEPSPDRGDQGTPDSAALGDVDCKDNGPYVPTSEILRRLIVQTPAGTVTLGWLIERLHLRSFGIVLLLLGVCGLLPVVSPVAGLLLAVPALQMLRGQQVPTFPGRLSRRPIPTERLIPLLGRAALVLRYMERFVRPRWPTPLQATKRIVGGFILLLGISLLAPIPLSNIPVGLTIILVAFAYLEEDGVLLSIALAATLVVFAVALAAIWGAVAATSWVIG